MKTVTCKQVPIYMYVLRPYSYVAGYVVEVKLAIQIFAAL